MPDTTTRRGPGRPPTGLPQKTTWGVSASPTDLGILRAYPNQNRIVELLASGLGLGAGNVGELTDTEAGILRATLSGIFLDALTVRSLPDEVRAYGTLEAAALASRMDAWGDWELLHVALRHG